ncbi:hypothetical protein [Nitrobacter winogradskyi]|uniref:hypothetical protein n=1 Tax=Nitrobacter winogradskyi TaxID=913 RepID=UPI001FCB1F8F|nr:hypothetical protein [Nitrobacter winogradskyi]
MFAQKSSSLGKCAIGGLPCFKNLRAAFSGQGIGRHERSVGQSALHSPLSRASQQQLRDVVHFEERLGLLSLFVCLIGHDSGGKGAYHDECGDDRGQYNAYLRLHYSDPSDAGKTPINRSLLIESQSLIWSLSKD